MGVWGLADPDDVLGRDGGEVAVGVELPDELVPGVEGPALLDLLVEADELLVGELGVIGQGVFEVVLVDIFVEPLDGEDPDFLFLGFHVVKRKPRCRSGAFVI